MRPRAAKDLGQLPDPDFFRAVSEGLSLIIANSERLLAAARTLRDAQHFQGTHVLTLLSEEEAAKFLILLDAVRCPRTLPQILARQLGYFHKHLARGIYAGLAHVRPIDLAELERYADLDRETLFLDGPNDVDWIFRNRVLAEREEAIYVDYVEADGGHEWHAPRCDELLTALHMAPQALIISRALHKTDMTTPQGLAIVARVWRPQKVHPGLRWDQVEAKNKETLDELERNGLLSKDCGDVYWHVVRHWPFPLYTLDLSPKEIDRKELERAREQWHPEI